MHLVLTNHLRRPGTSWGEPGLKHHCRLVSSVLHLPATADADQRRNHYGMPDLTAEDVAEIQTFQSRTCDDVSALRQADMASTFSQLGILEAEPAGGCGPVIRQPEDPSLSAGTQAFP